MIMMGNGRSWNARWLKAIVIVIKDWLVSWLTVDYTRACTKKRLAIRNTRLVFGLPTTTDHGEWQAAVALVAVSNSLYGSLPKTEQYRRSMDKRPIQTASAAPDVPQILGCTSKTYSSGR